MILYWGFIFVLYISHSILELRKSQQWYCLVLVALCLFVCFGYMTGSDWKSYELMYEEIDLNNLFYNYYLEPGYYIYMLVFKILNADFWVFFITTKVVVFLLFIRTINIHAWEYRYLVLMFFISWYGFYLFIDNPMRNLIAISIFLYAYKYILNKSFGKYFICILLASSFHITAIALIPLYFILLKYISTNFYICAILFLMLFVNNDNLSFLITHIAGINPYLQWKVETYLLSDAPEGQGSVFSVKMFFHVLIFILILFSRRKIERLPSGNVMLNASLFLILFYRIGLSLNIMYRLQLYLCVFYSIGVVLAAYAFTKKSFIIYTNYLLCLSLVAVFSIMTYKYVPYSNYLFYIFKDQPPSFSYRSNYNIKNTPFLNTIP